MLNARPIPAGVPDAPRRPEGRRTRDRDLFSTWRRHRLANRAAMASTLGALLVLMGVTMAAAALAHSEASEVFGVAALVLALATAAFARGAMLRRLLHDVKRDPAVPRLGGSL